ncbi:tetratricopeptide repeat domain-containing protein [Ditylenchus destructor]|uniref:Tetratricopeptide repeat domain-containing protein n=1 Tax=Ditylenchus destructor TaxID=166010 RepID=A0AAD4NAC9_9BILA|nr:tetratricopeptide repeat domain-containing protein [Ditylenchus destructor]
MLLSRLRPGRKKKEEDNLRRIEEIKKLDEFLDKRDYTGAISLMEHERKKDPTDINCHLWLAYLQFHAGDHRKASEVLESILTQKQCPSEANLYLGCALFFVAMYEDARKAAEKGPKNPLQNRLLFHVAHKLNDEKKLMLHHSQLKDTIEDQLCLASIHYLRSHYQQAIDIYKKILAKNKNYLALNVYLAMCYYKLDYYDVSMEVLQNYLEKYEDSPIAVNLKACNQYRLYNSKAAENELKTLKNLSQSELNFAKDIILHNTVVFRNGDAALQLLPTLVDVIPEARLNLVIYHLKKNDTDAAFVLMNHMEPQSTHDFMLKAITYCLKGTEEHSKEHLKAAAQFFKAVGESTSECDTIAGRQCMASAYFIRRQFEEVLVYLNSIKSFFLQDDVFNFNYGQAHLISENYEEAEKSLLAVSSHTIVSSLSYCMNLCRAYIANGKSKQAWNLYQKERHLPDSVNLLKLIANDLYRAGDFVYASKAYDELEKQDSVRNYNTAKRAACVGVVKMFTVNKASTDNLREAIQILEHDSNPLSQNAAAVTRKWAAEVNIYF